MSKELLGSIELNRIYQMDCLEGMKLIPNKSVDMILCDLPYGTTIAKWDSQISLDHLWVQYERILKESGVILLFGSQPFTSQLIMSNPTLFKEELIWKKDRASNFAQAKNRHLKYHENILVFSKGKYTYNRQMQPRLSDRVAQHQKTGYVEKDRVAKEDGTEIVFTKNYKGRSFEVYDAEVKNPSSVIECPIVNPNSAEKVNHSTQKPMKIFEYLINTYSNENELILDNCMGSGTTAVAALKTNRKFIGFETEPQYITLANLRIESFFNEKDDQKILDNKSF